MSKVTGCRCTDCGKVFGRKGDLNRHKRIHSGERPYVCPICQKGFTQGTALKTHANIHTKKKPHKCGLGGCTAAFGDPSSCSRHRREKHNGIQGFRCPVSECRTQIKRRSSFVAHLRKHKIRALTKEEITQMAIGPSVFIDSDPAMMLPVHKQEEEVIGVPSASYGFNPVIISEELEHIRSRSGSCTSDPSRSGCSSPLSIIDRSLDASSSNSSPSPHNGYGFSDGFPEYAQSLSHMRAPMAYTVQMEYQSATYSEPVGVHISYAPPAHYEPYVMDGYVSTSTSSTSSSPSSSSPVTLGYGLEHYSSVVATMSNDCTANALYEYPPGAPAEWSHPAGSFSYVSDDCQPILGMRY